jgi:hypothetical protein
MSSTNAETTTTDNTETEKQPNIYNFIIYIISIIIVIIIYVSCGGFILYGCKLAQSNILPTYINNFPYTDKKLSIKPILTNIFTTTKDNKSESVKLEFPYNTYNSKNLVLDMFREYKYEPNSNNIVNYFISLIESLMCFNYSALNLVLQKFNLLPESLIILLGPIVIPFILFFIFFFDNFYLIYLWFSNFGWFFKENENASGINEANEANESNKSKPQWKYVTLEEPVNYAWSRFIAFIFFILFWFVLFLALPVLPFITLTICVISCLLYESTINKEKMHSYDIVADVFKYNKVPIMIVISLFCIISAFTNLNTTTGLFSIFFILAIYFNLININLFKKIIPLNLSYPTASNQVALKTSIVDSTPFLSIPEDSGSTSTEKKALMSGGSKINFIKKLNKIVSR